MENENTVAKSTAEQARPWPNAAATAGCLLPSERRHFGAGRRTVWSWPTSPGARSDTIDVKFEDGLLEMPGGRRAARVRRPYLPAARVRGGRLLSQVSK